MMFYKKIVQHCLLETIFFFMILTMPSFSYTMQTSLPAQQGEEIEQSKGPWDYWLDDSLDIIRELISHRQTVSAFTATSPYGVNAIVKNVRGNKVLEVGAGPGTVSLPLAKKLEDCFPNGYRYDVVECLPKLYDELVYRLTPFSKQYTHTYQAYFQDWQPVGNEVGEGFYDTVVTTIPFTRLPKDCVQAILERVAFVLKPGGTFIYISLMGARWTGYASKGFKKVMNHLMCWRDEKTRREAIQELADYRSKLRIFDAWLSANFEQPVKKINVLRNLTPIYVFVCTKKNK